MSLVDEDNLPPPAQVAEMSPTRIWIDGCFDFTHHGHAGAMLQAKRLGTYLCVGVHSDASILRNKGPTVMNLRERILAVSACRWSDLPVPLAPYVTDPAWMDAYGCRYVVHGDDVTTDADGDDCYRIVKEAGRFRVVKRTPGISTTDLVGRMLLCTKTHHVKHLGAALRNPETGTHEIPAADAQDMLARMRMYASDAAGVEGLGPPVWEYIPTTVSCERIVSGVQPTAGKRIVYVDGGFDLFTPGHVEFLRQVASYYGDDEVYIVAGIHADAVINAHVGLNYPIMSIFERALCVLQCRYINALVMEAPYVPDATFLNVVGTTFGGDATSVEAVWHGPTRFMEGDEDTYAEAKRRGVYREVAEHEWSGVNAGEIVKRILGSREMYEERQRKKGVKAQSEVDMTN